MLSNHVLNSIAEVVAQKVLELCKPDVRGTVSYRSAEEENHQFKIQLGFNDREVMVIAAKLDTTPRELDSGLWLSTRDHHMAVFNDRNRRLDALVYYSPVDLTPMRVSAVLRAIVDALSGMGSDAVFCIEQNSDEELNIRAKNLQGHPDAGLSITIPLPQVVPQQQSN